MAHIFISYSKKNRDYARPLADHLLMCGFDVWIDDEIQPSEDWWRNIRQAIKDCAAFVLLMTPEAEDSHWVGLELLHALEYHKPLFPLLRLGDPNLLNSDSWSRIASIQYTDVRHGNLPPEKFIENLVRRGVPQRPSKGSDLTPPQPSPAGPVPPVDARHTGSSASAVLSLLPPPFAWCPIPAGKVTLGGNEGANGGYITKATVFDVPAFSIAKYPVTNAQYQVFVDASDGYADTRWWDYSKEAANWRRSETQPEDTAFAGDDQPLTNVPWYDSAAFCRWLSFKTSETIMLPSEQQWQRAAQGDDGRSYPWGNEWDCQRCNNRVKPCNSKATRPVRHYEGKNKGDSPYGVVDMSGNVWEWCLTEYESGSNDVNGTNKRVLRGGSWGLNYTDVFRVDYRNWNLPSDRNLDWGFRLALS